MKLKWGRTVGDIKEYYELESETVGEIIAVYQAIEGIVIDDEPESGPKTKPEGEHETSNLNTGNGTDPGNTGNGLQGQSGFLYGKRETRRFTL